MGGSTCWMRLWSVRVRMLGAVGVVLVLLLALVGVGVWAVHHMQIAQHEALTLVWEATAGKSGEALANEIVRLTERGEALKGQSICRQACPAAPPCCPYHHHTVFCQHPARPVGGHRCRRRCRAQRAAVGGGMLDHLRHALVVLDAQGRVVGHNLTALQLLELPEDLLRAQPTIDEVVRGQHARGDLQTLLQRVWYHLKRVQTTAEPHVYSFKRPSAVAPARRGGSAGKRMPAITAIDSRAIAASASYAPRNGVPSRLRVWLARLGPATAPIRPPASTNETAFSRYAGDASSPAAKR